MPTTTNYGWTTPADTDLVKDGASAIRTLGSSIDTSVKSLSPGTTAGDLDYYTSSTTKARIGIGTTGQILTVSGGVPTWAAAAGGGANWSLLNAGGTALTGAQTITVSGISSKDQIMILVDAASSGSTSNIGIRLNTDTASNYFRYGFNDVAPNAYSRDSFNRAQGSSSVIPLTESMAAGDAVSGYVLLSGCNASGVKIYNSIGAQSNDFSTTARRFGLGGYYNSSSTISSVSIFSSTGNFDAGTIYVYASA